MRVEASNSCRRVAPMILVGAIILLIAMSCEADEHRQVIRIGVVQSTSTDRAITENLRAVEPLVARAAEQGAQIVVLPEFLPSGYALNFSMWDAAEVANGETVRWLKRTSKKFGIYLGTSFLEANGDDFYNTFVITDPHGNECGRVRKEYPTGPETNFFRGEAGTHIIRTPLARIGVGICQENYRCSLAQRMYEGKADLILMPHSFPDTSMSGGWRAPPGTYIASWYATHLGVPVAMVNKVGPWSARTASGASVGTFSGLSAVVDATGRTQVLLGSQPGVGVADVVLDPTAKARWAPDCSGVAIAALHIGGDSADRVVPSAEQLEAMEAQGAAMYQANILRTAKARMIQSGNSITDN
jgi:N-carbamoylputrescine amidase